MSIAIPRSIALVSGMKPRSLRRDATQLVMRSVGSEEALGVQTSEEELLAISDSFT